MIGGHVSALVGRFTYRPATDSWTWSEEMYRIHGFEPGEVVPTTALVLRHLHPDDVEAAWVSRDDVLERGRPFVFQHRLCPAEGPTRVVIAAGHLEEDAEGDLVTGHLIDVTETGEEALRAHMDQVVEDFTVHRAVIEQAKGVLMQLFSTDAATAWEMLRSYSQHSNRRVRVVAQSLVKAASEDRTPSKDGEKDAVLRIIDDLLDG